MKNWKKNKRYRKRLMANKHVVNLNFTPEEYIKINAYRISMGYSWAKLVSVAIKNAVKLHNESGNKCVT